MLQRVKVVVSIQGIRIRLCVAFCIGNSMGAGLAAGQTSPSVASRIDRCREADVESASDVDE